MTTAERVAYLKGLMEGMKVDDSTNEGKLFNLIADILTDVTEDVANLEDFTAELSEQVDAIDEDLNLLESDYYDEWDDDDDEECCCGCGGDDEYYEVSCPSCGEEFEVDEDSLLDGSIDCPNCGEHLEFTCDDEDDEAEE